MKVSLCALVAIRKRIDHDAIPRFFDGKWSPRRTRARRERMDRWLGSYGRELVNDWAYTPADAIPYRMLSRRADWAPPHGFDASTRRMPAPDSDASASTRRLPSGQPKAPA